jgi:hypothetical protein
MRGDEQADICQSEDGEGILVDPVHALPKVKVLPPSCFVPLPQRTRPGLGCVGLHAISIVYDVHMVRITAYRCNHVRRNFGYLCVRYLFCSSPDSCADVEAQGFTRSREYDLRRFGDELTTIRNSGGVSGQEPVKK